MSFSTSLPPIGPNPSGTYGNASASLPTANNDQTQGYSVGSLWRHTGAFPIPETFVCDSASTGAAVWRPLNRRKMLAVCSATIGFPSSGSIGNNGALTGLSTFGTEYTSGYSAYLYFPLNAIAAGVAAGFYWTVLSSATTGTIYNNTYTTGDCIPPASPVAFSTTGPGAYTAPTGSNITTLNVVVPGNTIGPRDSVVFDWYTNQNATANNKYVNIAVSGDAGSQSNVISNFGSGSRVVLVCKGAGKQNTAPTFPTTPYGGQSTGYSKTTAYDFTASQTLQIQVNMANTVDWLVMNTATIELIRANS